MFKKTVVTFFLFLLFHFLFFFFFCATVFRIRRNLLLCRLITIFNSLQKLLGIDFTFYNYALKQFYGYTDHHQISIEHVIKRKVSGFKTTTTTATIIQTKRNDLQHRSLGQKNFQTFRLPRLTIFYTGTKHLWFGSKSNKIS